LQLRLLRGGLANHGQVGLQLIVCRLGLDALGSPQRHYEASFSVVSNSSCTSSNRIP
jgi:hypothetical protein